jgi:TPP-dependent pyruvate/acetoin dehydrogenase alpha subunit
MSSSKPKHKQAQEAVNKPPSRDPELMRRMYALLTRVQHGFAGREASVVGALMGLLPEDTLTISHARGLREILFQSAPEVLDLAPIAPKAKELDAAAQIAIAAGYALDRSLHEKHGLVLAFAGEATSLSSAHETLAFAFTHKLPLVVVVQHNLAKLQNHQVVDLSYEVLSVGLPGITVDGSDAMAVYRVTHEAMYRARHEGGPTLIECKIYPRAKIPTRFRAWVQGDALSYMEEQLRARGFWEDRLKSQA